MALFSKEPTPAHQPGRPDLPTLSGPTFIGTAITIDGTITGSEALVVEGTVRGKIDTSSEVRLGKQARVEATVHGKTVVIEGKVTGDITADERVELIASATVDGNIKAPKIVVAEGAKFRGNVDMGSPRPKDHPAETTAPSKSK
jgi:cytoskeletal protein CcmA (bactofilin family)